MFVVTADQQGSTRRGDRVADLLAETEAWQAAEGPTFVLPLERTVGDEVQTVLADAPSALALVLWLHRTGGWSVGVGTGAVTQLADSARASSGPAFVHARTAVERARSRAVPVPVVVAGPVTAAAEHATALLQMLAAVVRRRSRAGWEAVDLLDQGMRQSEVAAHLGISDQAVSQRLAVALHEEERALHPLAHELLDAAGQEE